MMGISEIKEDCCQVCIENIDDRPGAYCMSFGFDLDPLVQSIRRVGLINSPLLIKSRSEKLDIIIGYRRVQALKFLKWDKLPCRIVSSSDLDPLECLLMNLYDNLGTRVLNEIEKGMVLKRLLPWVQKNEILKHYMPILGLPSHEATLDFYLRINEEPDEQIKTSIIKKRLSLHTVRLLLELNSDERTKLFQFISDLNFNMNNQKQLIEYLIDIKDSNKTDISDILADETLKKIYSDPRMNNPQKTSAVLRVLRPKVFPRLAKAEKTFKKTLSALDLPEGVRINYSPFFESPNYRMEILFMNGEELKEKIARVSSKEGVFRLNDPWEKGS